MERRFGSMLAQQQGLMERQQVLIGELERKLDDREREHTAKVGKLEADVARLTRELLGPKSEKIKIPPVERDAEPPDADELARRKEESERKRRERALQRKAALEVDDVEYPLTAADKQCPACGGSDFIPLPPEASSTYEYLPGRFVRRRHHRHKAACRCGGHIVTAAAPRKLIDGAMYGPSFAAYVVVAKCADSIPVYRLEKRMQRMGIPVSRSTMNDLLHTAAEVLAPLVARLRARIPSLEIVLADETSMRLQDRRKRGFVWVFHGFDAASGGELVFYEFTTTRSGSTAVDVLGDSTGALVCDGYTGYNLVEDPERRARAGCTCHARRKVYEARATAPVEAEYVITEMRKLFRVEHEARALGIVGTADHHQLRQERSRPVLDKLFEWLIHTQRSILPKSPMGTAIQYMLNQRSRLELFLSDPRIPLHNNSSENRLRVVALGRKNYLFFGHPRAGRNIAGLYSLVGSCIANEVEPTAYLTAALTRVRDASTDEELDALLPDRWTPAG